MKRIAPAVRRELLLDAAFRVISRGGVQAATTRAICAEADMPLASFHYVFESQQELMRQLLHRVIDAAGNMERVPEFTDDLETNVELMLLHSFEWAVANPGEDLAYYELGNYAMRHEGMEDLARYRTEHAVELIIRAFYLLEAIHGSNMVRDKRDVAWMALTFVEGIGMMYLSSRDEQTCRRAIKSFAPFVVAYAQGRAGGPVES